MRFSLPFNPSHCFQALLIGLLLTAYFEYTGSEPLFELTLVSYPEGAGTLSGEGVYQKDALVDVSAVASDGYDFVNWTLGAGPLNCCLAGITINFISMRD